MPKKYIVCLTHQEREHLQKLVCVGKAHARKLLYGRILLRQIRHEHGHLDRRADSRSFRDEHCHRGAREAALLRRGAGGGAFTKEAGQAQKANLGRPSGSTADRPLVLRSSRREGALEHEASSGSDGGAWVRRFGLIRNRQHSKNELKSHLKRQWVIPPRESAAFSCRGWKKSWVLLMAFEPLTG